MANKDNSKGYFKKGDYPTDMQFAQVFDWLRWKDEKLSMSDVEGLQALLNVLQLSLNTIASGKADLVDGKVPVSQLPGSYNLIIVTNTETPTGILASKEAFMSALVAEDNPLLTLEAFDKKGQFIGINAVGLESLSESMFEGNSEIIAVYDRGVGIDWIDDKCFKGCENLTTVSLPLCTWQGDEAFAGSSIQELTVLDYDDDYYDQLKSIGRLYILNTRKAPLTIDKLIIEDLPEYSDNEDAEANGAVHGEIYRLPMADTTEGGHIYPLAVTVIPPKLELTMWFRGPDHEPISGVDYGTDDSDDVSMFIGLNPGQKMTVDWGDSNIEEYTSDYNGVTISHSYGYFLSGNEYVTIKMAFQYNNCSGVRVYPIGGRLVGVAGLEKFFIDFFIAQDGALSSDTVDYILKTIYDRSYYSGQIKLNYQVPSAPPSASGIEAKNNLIDKSWTVLTD